MASPSEKRFETRYAPIYDTIARLDIDQELREEIAEKLSDALAAGRGINEPAWFRREAADFNPSLFRLLASDPICLCAGFGDEPCPDQTEIRIGMHLSSAPDGRSAAWAQRKPVVRCVSCGAKEFVPGHRVLT